MPPRNHKSVNAHIKLVKDFYDIAPIYNMTVDLPIFIILGGSSQRIM